MSSETEIEIEDIGEGRAPKRLRRATRYQRAQERKAAQARADNRLYGAMFGLISVLSLIHI